MASYDKEDWVYIEQHKEAVEYLEGRKAELEQSLEDAEHDEAFILSNLIELRWRYSDYTDMHEELTWLIKLHSKAAIERALKMLENKFPKTPAEKWEV